jgi:ankyrin repeat protein
VINNNDYEMTCFLLEKGANINEVDKDGWKPHFFACNKQDLRIIKLLFEKCLKMIPHTSSISSNTPFFMKKSSKFNHEREGEGDGELIYEDLNMTDNYGKSLLHIAVENKNNVLISYLLEKGINVRIKNKMGLTAFQIAVSNNSYDIVKKLLSCNQDIIITKKDCELKLNGYFYLTWIQIYDFLKNKNCPENQEFLKIMNNNCIKYIFYQTKNRIKFLLFNSKMNSNKESFSTKLFDKIFDPYFLNFIKKEGIYDMIEKIIQSNFVENQNRDENENENKQKCHICFEKKIFYCINYHCQTQFENNDDKLEEIKNNIIHDRNNHICNDCYQKWYFKEKNNTCPFCKVQIKKIKTTEQIEYCQDIKKYIESFDI